MCGREGRREGVMGVKVAEWKFTEDVGVCAGQASFGSRVIEGKECVGDGSVWEMGVRQVQWKEK